MGGICPVWVFSFIKGKSQAWKRLNLDSTLAAAGGTLAEFIQKRCNSLLEEETILHFFVQILLALHHVHTHLILHRDLKTQNILLDKHRMVVKIGDFGISKILSSKSKAYTVPGHERESQGCWRFSGPWPTLQPYAPPHPQGLGPLAPDWVVLQEEALWSSLPGL